MMRDLSVEREIAAPLGLVWRCLTQGAHLARWWVSAPVELVELVLEPVPGGRFSYGMNLEDGSRFDLDMMILSAAAPRLVFTDLMSAGFQPMAAPVFGFGRSLGLAGLWVFRRAGIKRSAQWHALPRHGASCARGGCQAP
jgi:uncharacterized protein YndB with AHSA1/START domain